MFFVASGGLWLLMLGRQGIASLRRWSTTVPMSTTGRRNTDDHDGAYGYAAVGRTLAVAGLVAAVVVPVVIPHFPTRYLIDGLGRSNEATGFSDGQIGLKSTLDLTKSLKTPSKAPVLSYTTNAADPDAVAGRGARELPGRQLAARARRGRLRPSQQLGAPAQPSSATTCPGRPTGSRSRTPGSRLRRSPRPLPW